MILCVVCMLYLCLIRFAHNSSMICVHLNRIPWAWKLQSPDLDTLRSIFFRRVCRCASAATALHMIFYPFLKYSFWRGKLRMSFSNSWWIDWSNWFIDWIYLFRWWMPRNFFWCQRSESIVFCVRFVVNSMMWPFVVLIPHSPIRLLDVFCWITTHRSIIMNWAIYPTFWKRVAIVFSLFGRPSFYCRQMVAHCCVRFQFVFIFLSIIFSISLPSRRLLACSHGTRIWQKMRNYNRHFARAAHMLITTISKTSGGIVNSKE